MTKHFSVRHLAAVNAAALMLMTPLSLGAKDLGIFYGEPTPAYAMYAAQVNFAGTACANADLVEQSKPVAMFVKHFNNRSEFARYRKRDPDFNAAVIRFEHTYANAWQRSTSDERAVFCSAFRTDAFTYDAMTWMQRSYLMVFRSQFSPISEASRARQKRIVGGLSLFGAVASVAGSVTAADDAVSSARAGDWAASNQQMAASRNINQTGMALTSIGMSAATTLPFLAVLDLPDGTIIRCPVTDHFYSHDAPQEDSIWATYQPVAVLCRDPAAPPPKKPKDD